MNNSLLMTMKNVAEDLYFVGVRRKRNVAL